MINIQNKKFSQYQQHSNFNNTQKIRESMINCIHMVAQIALQSLFINFKQVILTYR